MKNILQNLKIRSNINRKSQRGQGLVATTMTIVLTTTIVLAMVQAALILRVRLTLEYAAHEAARSGAMNNGVLVPFEVNLSSIFRSANVSANDPSNPNFDTKKLTKSGAKALLNNLNRGSIWFGLVRGMMPLYTSGEPIEAAGLAKRWGHTNVDLISSSCIEVLNPTHQSFVDWGLIEFNGPNRYIYQIPNDTLRYRKPLEYDKADKINPIKTTPLPNEGLRGHFSKKTLPEANVLHLRVHYGYSLTIPIVNSIILAGYKATIYASGRVPTKFENIMLGNGKLPLSAEGVVGMQTPLFWHPFYAFGPAVKNDLAANLGDVDNWAIEAGESYDLNDFMLPSMYIGALQSFINSGLQGLVSAAQGETLNAVAKGIGNSIAFCPAVWGEDIAGPLKNNTELFKDQKDAPGAD